MRQNTNLFFTKLYLFYYYTFECWYPVFLNSETYLCYWTDKHQIVRSKTLKKVFFHLTSKHDEFRNVPIFSSALIVALCVRLEKFLLCLLALCLTFLILPQAYKPLFKKLVFSHNYYFLKLSSISKFVRFHRVNQNLQY